MTLKQKMRHARSLYAQWQMAASAVMTELERRAGDFECDIPSVRTIQQTVADAHQLPVSVMFSPIRSGSFSDARHMAMAIARELTPHSLEEVGRCFGGRDHGTVMHAEKKIAARLETEPAFARRYADMRESCRISLDQRKQLAA